MIEILISLRSEPGLTTAEWVAHWTMEEISCSAKDAEKVRMGFPADSVNVRRSYIPVTWQITSGMILYGD